MVKAVRANSVPAWHLLAQNEDHGYARKETQDYAFWASLLFWQRNVFGGGAPPRGVVRRVPGASAATVGATAHPWFGPGAA
jgi:hypothetical protein